MFRVRRKSTKFCISSLFLFLFVGCASAPERNPLPLEYTNQAVIPGIPEARFWGDEWPTFSVERFSEFTEAEFQEYFEGIYNKSHNYLAISGGGPQGAYGAGLLYGWSETGTRPEFTMVTGISTGALTAPFAFLGKDYDETLKTVYTQLSTKDILIKRSFLSAIFNDSIADTTPLSKVIAKFITQTVIEEIAIEHQKGRRLLIGTVNLDASRSVIWNIGAIALSEHPNKLELIHQILRASSAIPVAFPPVVIQVESQGRLYDELHVDGGTGSQVFVYPAAIDWKLIIEKLKVKGPPHVYVIRNSILDPDYRGVKREIVPIASKTISSLIRTQGIGDLYQIFALCKRDGNEFNLAYIPSKFNEEPKEDFDPDYMTKLFNLGRQLGRDGYKWEKAPPNF